MTLHNLLHEPLWDIQPSDGHYSTDCTGTECNGCVVGVNSEDCSSCE